MFIVDGDVEVIEGNALVRAATSKGHNHVIDKTNTEAVQVSARRRKSAFAVDQLFKSGCPISESGANI